MPANVDRILAQLSAALADANPACDSDAYTCIQAWLDERRSDTANVPSAATPNVRVLSLSDHADDDGQAARSTEKASRRRRSRVVSRGPLSRTTQAIEKTVNWKRGALLGRGATGTVHLGLNLDTGELMAVKQLIFCRKDPNVASKIRDLQQEISMLQRLNHPLVVKYFFSERVGTTMNVFTEYVPGGSLHGILQSFGPLDETVVVQYAAQLLTALDHLHSNGIIHRDVKGANVLLTVDGTIKLGDFGSAAMSQGDLKATGMRGTLQWMAPEVLRGEDHMWSADIWSLGCTVLEMLTGMNPWEHLGYDRFKLMAYICGAEGDDIVLPDNVASATARSFVRACLTRKPEDRPSTKQLLMHPFFFDCEDCWSKSLSLRSQDAPVSPALSRKSSSSVPSRDASPAVVEHPLLHHDPIRDTGLQKVIDAQSRTRSNALMSLDDGDCLRASVMVVGTPVPAEPPKKRAEPTHRPSRRTVLEMEPPSPTIKNFKPVD